MKRGSTFLAAGCTAVLAAAAPAWAGGGPDLELNIQPGSECVRPLEPVRVILRMEDIPLGGPGAAGYQAFVKFDTKKLTFVSGKYLNTPFGLPVLQPIHASPAGVISLAAGIDVFAGQQPTHADSDLAILEFAAKEEDCEVTVGWCEQGCQPNIITDINANALPGLEKDESDPIRIDGTAPRITSCCPNTKLSANSSCRALLPDLRGCVTAQDNCDKPAEMTVVQFPAAGTLLGLGTTWVTLTVSDCAGNSTTCQTSVTVNDTTPPVIKNCPGNRTLKADNSCKARIPDLRGEVLANDNCDNSTLLTITQSPAPNTQITGQGTTPVTITVADNHGNSSKCTVEIRVIDAMPPKIAICPNDRTIKADEDCEATVPALTGNVIAVDNCTIRPLLVITQNPAAGTVLEGQGETIVTITVADKNGLTDTCEVVLTVVDSTPPVIHNCGEEITVELDQNCRAHMPNLTKAVSASDNCTPVTITQSKPVGSNILGQGTIWVTITATDAKGNTSSCEVPVTAADKLAPKILQCANPVKIPADALCQAVIPQMYGGLVAVDNCDNAVSKSQNPPAGTIVGKGKHEVVLTATDDKGNSSTCVTHVQVFDNTPPVITCPANIVAQCTGPEGAFVAFRDQLKVSDNCSEPSVNCFEVDEAGDVVGIVNPQGQVYPNKERTFVLCRAIDAQENIAQCLFTVSVVDTTAPVIVECPTLEPIKANEICKAVVPDLRDRLVARDLCDTHPVVTQVPPVGSSLNGQGSYLVTLIVTDNSGNHTSCKVEVLVEDTTPPVFTRCSNDLTLKANARCEAQIPNLLPGVHAVDNCAEKIIITQSPAPNTVVEPGEHKVTFTATDEKGNKSTCSVTVEVNDQTAPKIFSCPEDMELKVIEDCMTVVPELIAKATDNCNDMDELEVSQSPEAGTPIGLGHHVVTITVADKAGNTDSCQVHLTVVDNEAPAITCPESKEAKADATVCSTHVEVGEAKATDNCKVEKIKGERSDGLALNAAYPLGKTVITWTAVDSHGNESSCTQSITVIDNLAPILTCPPNKSFNADAGTCSKQVHPGVAVAKDNCKGNIKITARRSDGQDLDELYPTGTTTITWTATDLAGNSTQCQQRITVSPLNTLVVDIDMAKTLASPLTRCITFELWNCGEDDDEPVEVVEANITFINGSARNVPVKVPCGEYTCVTAQDRLHTLRRSDFSLVIADGVYEASFTGDDQLVGGDLNDDGIIDIIDWATFAGNFMDVYGSGNTNCDGPWDPETKPHADISGNGFVFVEEHTFISANFRKRDEKNCCSPQGGGLAEADDEAGMGSISVDALIERGLGHLALADLNGDGSIDLADMSAFEAGTQPQPVREFAGHDGGTWFDAANWEKGLQPDANTNVLINVDVLVDRQGGLARSIRIAESGSLTLTAGSLDAASITVENGGALRLDDAAALLDVTSLTLAEGARLEWRAGSIVIDGGTLTMNEPLNVGEGLLNVLNGGQITAPHVFVGTTGEVVIDGLVQGDLTNDGLLQPELLTVDGHFGQSVTGSLALEVGGALSAQAHDQVLVLGDAVLDGTLTVTLTGGFQPQVGDRFEIVRADSVSGRFARLDLPALQSGLRFQVVYGENTVVLQTVRAAR